MAKSAGDRVSLRGGVYYYIRRVPKRFAHLDRRVIVRVSLHTDNQRAAQTAAQRMERETEILWASLAAQGNADAWTRYHAAIERARLEGFAYRSAAEIAEGRLADILERMEALADRVDDPAAVTAIAGGEAEPEVRLSGVLPLFTRFVAGELVGKREDQIRRWTNARSLAIDNFITVIGEDKQLVDLTREDARKVRDWWLDRIRNEGYGRNSLNKQVSYLSRMIATVAEEMKLGVDPIFSRLGVVERKRTRPPFTRAFVERKILRPGALAGLNLDARVAVLVCMETGMGPEEVASLRQETIHLRGPIPYVSIVSREMAEQKTDYRPRDIPLVGVALQAMRLRPAGVERYHDKPTSLSAAVNKFLDQNGLLESDRHSLYSFRHSFQDRLTTAEAPDRLQADLMGHKYIRERYGVGPSLAQKRRWLQRIAYRAGDGFEI